MSVQDDDVTVPERPADEDSSSSLEEALARAADEPEVAPAAPPPVPLPAAPAPSVAAPAPASAAAPPAPPSATPSLSDEARAVPMFARPRGFDRAAKPGLSLSAALPIVAALAVVLPTLVAIAAAQGGGAQTSTTGAPTTAGAATTAAAPSGTAAASHDPTPAVVDPRAAAASKDVEAAIAELDAALVASERAVVDAAKLRGRVALDDAARALMRRIAVARDDRRAKGATGADLRAPFTLDELRPVLKDIGVADGGGRLVVRRDGVVVAPLGADAPAGIASTTRTNDPLERAVDDHRVVLRACVEGELLCLVETVALSGAPPPSTAALQRALAARAAAVPATATVPAAPVVVVAPVVAIPPAPATSPSTTGLVAAALLACAGAALLVALLRRTGATLRAAEARLRLLASGRSSSRAELPRPAELARVEDAIDLVAQRCAETDDARALDDLRGASLARIAAVIDEAAGGRLDARVDPPAAGEEQVLAAAVNHLLDDVERRALRMKSHLDALAGEADGDGDSAAEIARKVQALAPVTTLLSDLAQRLSVLARHPETGARAANELGRLAEAVQQRARAAGALLDALATDVQRASGGSLDERGRQALGHLRGDLEGLSVRADPTRLVAALRDLPPAVIASRLPPPT